jgi:hypothetical protein
LDPSVSDHVVESIGNPLEAASFIVVFQGTQKQLGIGFTFSANSRVSGSDN